MGRQPPHVITKGGGGLGDPRMYTALGLGFLAMTLLAALLLWSRAPPGAARVASLSSEERAIATGLTEDL